MMIVRSAITWMCAAFVGGIFLTGCQTGGGPSGLAPSVATNRDHKNNTSYYFPPELWNGFVVPPGTSGPQPTNFDIVFSGNVTADFPSPLQPGFGGYDAFCPVSQTCNNESVTFNPTSNTTTFSFYGTTLYKNITGHGNEVHFGILNGPGGVHVKCLKWYAEWTFATASPQQTPVLNVCNPKKVKTKPAAAGSAIVFATVFVETSFSPITSSKPATSGTWIDIAYNQVGSKTQPKFKFTNATSKTIFTANAGIVLNEAYPTDSNCVKDLYCKENISNLELLNYAGMPPPGSPSSPFIKMRYPPPSKIPPGK